MNKLDKTAKETRRDPREIAREYEDEFHACMKALHFRTPHELPRATEYIEQMGEIIGDLLARDFADQVDGNDGREFR